LNRDYQATFKPGTIQQTAAIWYPGEQSVPSPSAYYPDAYSSNNVPTSKLRDHTGGGYNDPGLTTWGGWWPDYANGTVTVTVDLGFVQPVSKVRALSLSQGSWGIFHPQSMTARISSDGVTYALLGTASTPWPNTTAFSVGWTELPANATGRYVQCTFSEAPSEWLFLGELEVLGPAQAGVSVSVDPQAVGLRTGQSQLFTATVSGAGNTAVTWSLSPAIGSISNGLYTAPATGTISATQTVSVTAVSVADTTKSATAQITITPDTPLQLSVAPANGTGTAQLFHFSAQSGSSITTVAAIFNNSQNAAYACFVLYYPEDNTLWLADDTMSSWVTALVGGQGILQNSQCTIDPANSSVTQTASSVTLNLSVAFSAGWVGSKQIYMYGFDTAGDAIEGQLVGYWVVPTAAAARAPGAWGAGYLAARWRPREPSPFGRVDPGYRQELHAGGLGVF
jgi:hypothetical protein